MSLLFEEDYQYLKESGLDYEEDQGQRFLIIKNYPLPQSLHTQDGNPAEHIEVLWIVPSNYNTSGGDMFWVHPGVIRADGAPIQAAFLFGGGDARHYNGKEYCRWSRHWTKPGSWTPKVDNIKKVLTRIEWALQDAGEPR